MYRCIVCGWETVLDDVVAKRPGGQCLCLQCVSGITRLKALRKEVVRDLINALEEADA